MPRQFEESLTETENPNFTIVTDEELDRFINLGLQGGSGIKREDARAILLVGRLYDRNFELMRRFKYSDNAVRKKQIERVEKMLNDLSIQLRDLAGIYKMGQSGLGEEPK